METTIDSLPDFAEDLQSPVATLAKKKEGDPSSPADSLPDLVDDGAVGVSVDSLPDFDVELFAPAAKTTPTAPTVPAAAARKSDKAEPWARARGRTS